MGMDNVVSALIGLLVSLIVLLVVMTVWAPITTTAGTEVGKVTIQCQAGAGAEENFFSCNGSNLSIIMHKILNLNGTDDITISTGTLTQTQTFISVDGESASADILDTIASPAGGALCIIRIENDARPITLTHDAGDGGFLLPDNQNLDLSS